VNGVFEFVGAVALVLVGVFVWQYVQRSRDESQCRQAVGRVSQALNDLGKRHPMGGSGSMPSQVAWAIGQYCDAADRVDMSGCPEDFKVATADWVGALREFQQAIQQYPESYLQGAATGALNFLARGEVDGGENRIKGAIKQSADRLRERHEELNRVQAKYTH